MLSKSGQTKDLFDSIKYCKDNKIKIAAINMNPESVLAKNSDYNLIIPETKESSNIGAPTSSALMMLSLCDALVVTLHESKNFTKADFHKFHPGGSLGASLGEG
jgi:arabinose-5-phosphate isomerase